MWEINTVLQEMINPDYPKKAKSESVYWSTSAHELHVTARVLWGSFEASDTILTETMQEMGVGNSYLMRGCLARTIALNAGLSIELFLKACVIELKGELPNNMFHHKLIALTECAGVIFSADELKKLSILTEFIYWAGKYPIDKSDESLANLVRKMEDAGVTAPADYATCPITQEEYLEIWKKLSVHFMGIGGFGELQSDGSYQKPFKEGKVWKVVKEVSEPARTSIEDHQNDLTVAEAYVLAEKLNSEREASHIQTRYYTDEM